MTIFVCIKLRSIVKLCYESVHGKIGMELLCRYLHPNVGAVWQGALLDQKKGVEHVRLHRKSSPIYTVFALSRNAG